MSASIDELFGSGALPRYVVSRAVITSGLPWSRSRVAWHPVPADLARHRDRATAFHVAWQRWLGDGELVFCQGSDPRGPALAAQATAAPAFDTQRRRIWT